MGNLLSKDSIIVGKNFVMYWENGRWWSVNSAGGGMPAYKVDYADRTVQDWWYDVSSSDAVAL